MNMTNICALNSKIPKCFRKPCLTHPSLFRSLLDAPDFSVLKQTTESVLMLQSQTSSSGWWFGTFFIFPYSGLLIIPFDFHIFQRGPTTNQSSMKFQESPEIPVFHHSSSQDSQQLPRPPGAGALGILGAGEKRWKQKGLLGSDPREHVVYRMNHDYCKII